METGGLDSANNKTDPNIPEGKLGAEHYAILQIAVIITDGNLKEIGEPLNIVIYQSEESLNKRVADTPIAEARGFFKVIHSSVF